MIDKKAIQLAMGAGWSPPTTKSIEGVSFLLGKTSLLFGRTRQDYESQFTVSAYRIALDPSFWQALGKALGWSEFEDETGHYFWRVTAHDFYDLILTGGDTEKFWDDLLTHPH